METAGLQKRNAEVSISLKEFFEKIPPGKSVTNVKVPSVRGDYGPFTPLPELELYCDSPSCDDVLYFEPHGRLNLVDGKLEQEFVKYQCKHCEKTNKTFAIAILWRVGSQSADMHKFGEVPSFGPPTPRRVQALLGENKELFFQGRKSESQGMGIGAFAYYRRVVDAQRNALFDELIKVSKVLKAPAELVKQLEIAKGEPQFTKAVESIKHALPDGLLINGHNPLTLLYTALSEGLHNESDADCLALAGAIREVLADLVERMAAATREDTNLQKALNHLMNRKKPPGTAGSPTAA